MTPAGVVDVIVVGAGVVGASCAYFLSAAGLKVVLIERGGVASGTSSAGQSTVGIGVGTIPALEYFEAAYETYLQLLRAGFDLGMTPTPSLVVARSEEEAHQLRDAVQTLRAQGDDCSLVDVSQIGEIEPQLSTSVAAIAIEPRTAQVNPMRVASELVQAAADRGAKVLCDTELVGVDVSQSRFHSVQTSAGTIAAQHLVIAAGVWSRAVARLAGVAIPLWPRKGHIVVTEPLPGWLRHCIVEFGYEASLGGGFAADNSSDVPDSAAVVGTIVQPMPSGQILVGSSRELSDIDTSVSRSRLRQIVDRAVSLLPALGSKRAIRCYAGLRPWTPDGRPLIGRCEQIQGLLLATGHGGGGISGGPLTGRLIAALLADDKPPIDMAALLPDRLGDSLYAVGLT